MPTKDEIAAAAERLLNDAWDGKYLAPLGCAATWSHAKSTTRTTGCTASLHT